ncbi:Metallo-dependent phosphatase-like protein, partial [Protomyces lactucae-debilis]
VAPLPWGQINFLHTTDTHGYLAGSLAESAKSYSADFGDMSAFVSRSKAIADRLGVDLLLLDSGDLHDGTALGDNSSPNGALTLPLFANLPYDVLSIGNHELYTTEIATNTYNTFAPKWGGRYLTSNVDIYINGTRRPFSDRYAYFTTKFGLRILSFGFLFNFTGNSNASVVTPVGTAVNQTWFQAQARRSDIDLFVVVGHVTMRDSPEWDSVYKAIRAHHPATPIAFFGGHRHIRDFVVYDSSAVGLASGRYCETIGFMSISGFGNKTRANTPTGLGRSIKPGQGRNVTGAKRNVNSSLTFARSYLDFNRNTFIKLTTNGSSPFNTSLGLEITRNITDARLALNLTAVFGCSPGDYYQSRYPVSSNMSIFNYLTNEVFPRVMVAPGREDQPRIALINTGAVRYDLYKGKFGLDNAYQIIPFTNTILRKEVPWGVAKNLLKNMQTDRVYKRQEQIDLSLGYATNDDFGRDGDNPQHIPLPFASSPRYVQSNSSLPEDISDETIVDVY